MRLENGGISAECLLNGNIINVNISGCEKPLRVYAMGDTLYYGGIAEPYGINSCGLKFSSPFVPYAVIVSDGRIDGEHSEIFRFIFSEITYSVKAQFPKIFVNDFEKELFSQDSVKACFDFYGHYVVFSKNELTYYAFPSDFFTHPLLQFLPYSFWYNVDICGKHKGYYFTANANGAKFADFDAVSELLRNKNNIDEQ